MCKALRLPDERCWIIVRCSPHSHGLLATNWNQKRLSSTHTYRDWADQVKNCHGILVSHCYRNSEALISKMHHKGSEAFLFKVGGITLSQCLRAVVLLYQISCWNCKVLCNECLQCRVATVELLSINQPETLWKCWHFPFLFFFFL